MSDLIWQNMCMWVDSQKELGFTSQEILSNIDFNIVNGVHNTLFRWFISGTLKNISHVQAVMSGWYVYGVFVDKNIMSGIVFESDESILKEADLFNWDSKTSTIFRIKTIKVLLVFSHYQLEKKPIIL